MRVRLFGKVAAFAVLGLGLSTAPGRADNLVVNAAAGAQLYVWNRVADFFEIVNGGVALGPAIGAEVALTEYATLGAYAAKETGVTFPHFLPPLWIVTYLDNEDVFRKHEGTYWTRSFGPWRKESSFLRDVRFERNPWNLRAQAGLGLAQVQLRINPLEIGDFLTGFVGLDLSKDDHKLSKIVDRQPGRQLGRGINNVLLGFWEIPKSVGQVSRSKGDFAGATWGIFRGLYRMAARELTGVFEIVTFPMGWGPVIEPEYPFQPDVLYDWKVNPLPFMTDWDK